MRNSNADHEIHKAYDNEIASGDNRQSGLVVSLDARGMLCPEPILRVTDKMKAISDEEILEVTSDDPGIVKDLPAWCKCSGNKITKFVERGGVYKFYIQKGK
ncbi:MAG: sulfurtransferase TusA family protein [Candidatus Omnitrophica bacterium]|nr:sulfurtransferase TusA family protein [Candidatus Omnitrophota bacterium]